MKKVTLLDGGMGQELVKRSQTKPTDLWAIQFLIDAPKLIAEVHRDFFEAGADIATVNSYAIHRKRLRSKGLEDRFIKLHQLACELALRERDKHGSGLVAGSLGPIGWSYRPDLAPSADEAADIFAEIALIQKPYVDIILCETMSSVEEARGAVMGAKTADKPIWLSVSVDDSDGTKLRSHESVTQVLPLIEECGVDVVLVNCSVPEAIGQAVPLLVNRGAPVGAYANGFVEIPSAFLNQGANVDILETRNNLTPKIYADFAEKWINKGASIVGGCCEVGPQHIKELAIRFKS